MNLIDIAVAERYLGQAIDKMIPAFGEEVRAAGTANISTGGESMDVTEELPEAMIKDAESIAQHLKIAACGVDFMYDPKAKSYNFIEVNTNPGFFGTHVKPTHGKARDVHKLFVDLLLSEQQ